VHASSYCLQEDRSGRGNEKPLIAGKTSATNFGCTPFVSEQATRLQKFLWVFCRRLNTGL
jgi:hypothetical protein